MIVNRSICRSLWVAAIYLLTAVVLNALRLRHVIGAETVERGMGLLMGAVVLVSANAIPKRLMPLVRMSCDPAREQNLRRFGGRVLVLGSLGFMLAYALAPIGMASTLAICMLAPATVIVAVVVARCAWTHRIAGRGNA